MEMLKEAFMERGTLYKLSGPAFRLVETKIVGLLRNAEKLGMELGEYEVNLIRDRANQAVFDVAKRELHLAVLSLAVKETPPMREKKKKLIMLLKRIKEESNVVDDLDLPESELTDRVKLQQ